MANQTPKWDYLGGFDDFVHMKRDNGDPVTVMDIANKYLPEGRKINVFKQQVYRHARSADWERRRAEIWEREGRICTPEMIPGGVPDSAPAPDRVLVSDGFVCPGCGASLVLEDDALAQDAETIRDLRKIVKQIMTNIESAGGDTQAPMLNSLTGSLDKLIKMQERQQIAVQSAVAKQVSHTMTDTESEELDRLVPVFIELVARAPNKVYNRVKKRIDSMMPLPKADEPTVVNIEKVHVR